MIPRKPSNTTIAVAKLFNNFLAHFNSTAHDRQHPLFEGQESHLGEIGLKTHKNDYLRAFLEIKNVFDAFGTYHVCF